MNQSLPSRERGLKLSNGDQDTQIVLVAPLAGAWIEIRKFCTSWKKKTPSLPSRERGLKLRKVSCSLYPLLSLPSRERGLKCPSSQTSWSLTSVAPLAGAWIEIRFRPSRSCTLLPSLPSRERGLKCERGKIFNGVICFV